MGHRETFYPESRFGGFTDIDGTIVFYNRVNALLDATSVVLDVGCARGATAGDPVALRRHLRSFKGRVARVIGIDVDPAARDNPFLDEFHLIDGPTWSVASDSVDVIVCDNVLEHVPDPPAMFAEFRRVLRDGGRLCIRTPNRWSYIAIAARLIPNRFHGKVTSRVQEHRDESDVFPTVYRCNTVGKVRRMMKQSGFDAVVYSYEAEPSYLSFSKVAYALGVAHQKLAPSFVRPSIFAFGTLRK